MIFRHAGIVTKNINSLIDFYQNILGFKIEKDLIETGTFISSICGIPNTEVRTVKMSLNNVVVLELLDFKNNNEDKLNSRHIMSNGYTHIALTVDNLDELFVFMKNEKHIEFTTEPLISPDGKAKVTFCRDPDGNLIELVQELK